MLPEYESELYPFWHEEQDYDWGKAMLLSLPTDKLKREYNVLAARLEKHREEEPSMKRGQKSKYRAWIKYTHDIRDLLNEVAEELRSRQ